MTETRRHVRNSTDTVTHDTVAHIVTHGIVAHSTVT